MSAKKKEENKKLADWKKPKLMGVEILSAQKKSKDLKSRIAGYLDEARRVLLLNSWLIGVDFDCHDDGTIMETSSMPDYRETTVSVNLQFSRSFSFNFIRGICFHEMIHVCLSRFADLARKRSSTGEQLRFAEEEVVSHLAKIVADLSSGKPGQLAGVYAFDPLLVENRENLKKKIFQFLEEARQVLRLDSWRVVVDFDLANEGVTMRTLYFSEYKKAEVSVQLNYCGALEESVLRYACFHEMMHVCLSNLSSLARSRTVTREQLSFVEEEVATLLGRVIAELSA